MEMPSSSSSTRTSPAAVKLMLFLALTTSPASKVIAKGGKKLQVDGSGGGAFQCRTCGRRFATFQALGGHRTSHKRPRVRAHGLDLLLGARPAKGRAPVQHRCGTCGSVFATGQALGGHMRRHRPVAVAATTWTEATSSSSSSSGLSGQHDDDDNDVWPATLIQFI